MCFSVHTHECPLARAGLGAEIGGRDKEEICRTRNLYFVNAIEVILINTQV